MHSSRSVRLSRFRGGSTRPERSGIALVGLAGIAWGTAPVAFHVVYDRTDLGAVAISAHRLAIAAAVLLAVVVLHGRLSSVRSELRGRGRSVALVGLGVAGYQVMWFAAIPHIGVSVATVVSLGLAPILLTAWDGVRRRRRPGAARLAIVCGAVLGLALISLSTHSGPDGSTLPALGLALAGASGAMYAVTTVLSRRLAPAVSTLTLSTSTTTIGALALMPVAVLVGPVLTAQPTALLALGYLGVVTMAAGYWLLFAGLRTTGADSAVIATLLEPVTATVLALALLGEHVPPTAFLGMGLILVAIAALGSPAAQRR
ncbi:MAG: EamA family transporter [Dermatophilaceae bacterium]